MNRRVSYNSLRDQLFQEIRKDILTNKYAPGEELQIDKLAALFEVSTTPVREALVRLEAEGLVKLIPNRGVRVTPISLTDIKNIWELRQLLEPHAALATAKCCSDVELDAIEDNLNQVLRSPDDFAAYTRSDQELHTLLAKYITNEDLADILNRIWERSLRIRYFTEENKLSLRQEVIEQATLEHLEIVQALRDRDPNKVSELVFQHLVNGEKRTLKGLKEAGSM
ncbi:MAG: GntR family transcriptional regulator [bacterium]